MAGLLNNINNAPNLTNTMTQLSPTLGALNSGALMTQGANIANNASNLAGNIGKAGGFMNKLSNGLDMANKFSAPVQAGLGIVGLGFDIANSIEANKRAKEQLDLSKKNFNLELEKMQKNELANNKLAASIDKAWGGDGKIENTIDYSQYKTDSGGGNSLQAGGAGGGYVGGNPSEPSLSGSGAMPITSGTTLTPVGYSDSINESQDTEQEAGETQA